MVVVNEEILVSVEFDLIDIMVMFDEDYSVFGVIQMGVLSVLWFVGDCLLKMLCFLLCDDEEFEGDEMFELWFVNFEGIGLSMSLEGQEILVVMVVIQDDEVVLIEIVGL